MKKQKFFVVWVGKETGIFTSWKECEDRVSGHPGAKFKSFQSKEEAEAAFKLDYACFIGKDKKSKLITEEDRTKCGSPIGNSIAVDGAWNTKTGMVEYQGVYTETRTPLFHVGPMEDGTNNIVEFLAIVHALGYCKQHRMDIPIYSDSKIAIGWIKAKKARTKHQPSQKNSKLFNLINRAEKWLKENTYPNKILKWETKAWGENPADFGRK